mmetsp:Transcript_51545/g.165626  ORF Transcript_51545/g.165626 Transcript_51545/m.165626 type:complete len:219 (-) Transcript_51545:568-1224(-)
MGSTCGIGAAVRPITSAVAIAVAFADAVSVAIVTIAVSIGIVVARLRSEPRAPWPPSPFSTGTARTVGHVLWGFAPRRFPIGLTIRHQHLLPGSHIPLRCPRLQKRLVEIPPRINVGRGIAVVVKSTEAKGQHHHPRGRGIAEEVAGEDVVAELAVADLGVNHGQHGDVLHELAPLPAARRKGSRAVQRGGAGERAGRLGAAPEGPGHLGEHVLLLHS